MMCVLSPVPISPAHMLFFTQDISSYMQRKMVMRGSATVVTCSSHACNRVFDCAAKNEGTAKKRFAADGVRTYDLGISNPTRCR